MDRRLRVGHTLIKVCGVTRPADAEAAARAGVDAIGVNLWPGSKRYVDRPAALEVFAVLPSSVERFGVFVDASVEEVRSAMAELSLDRAQLHGQESDIHRYGERAFKAVRLAGAEVVDGLGQWPGPFVLVDAYEPGRPGGTGRIADWALAARAARIRGVWLAGGLTPENVAEAIRQVHPLGVDVASGVERSPGIKDNYLIEAFVQAARSA